MYRSSCYVSKQAEIQWTRVRAECFDRTQVATGHDMVAAIFRDLHYFFVFTYTPCAEFWQDKIFADLINFLKIWNLISYRAVQKKNAPRPFWILSLSSTGRECVWTYNFLTKTESFSVFSSFYCVGKSKRKVKFFLLDTFFEFYR